mmetsp:Transcript_14074/g.29726  ORF Transcript_14074/g.29726 Transcript_14074/m.29726 type:complete len:197 (-) Transcript_14074:3711-4301(-)
MKILSCLLLGFNWQQRLQLAPPKDGNAKIANVLGTAGSVGQAGSLASEEDRMLMEEVAKEAIPLSLNKPARVPLTGKHKLIYSAAPGASSGRIFGNVVGKVSQVFEDDETFYNIVDLGPLQIALRAKREIKNDSTIKVSFLETSFNLFGKTVKKSEVKGGGVWKVKFVGKVEDENGNQKLVRIMETPSLFVLEQDL